MMLAQPLTSETDAAMTTSANERSADRVIMRETFPCSVWLESTFSMGAMIATPSTGSRALGTVSASTFSRGAAVIAGRPHLAPGGGRKVVSEVNQLTRRPKRAVRTATRATERRQRTLLLTAAAPCAFNDLRQRRCWRRSHTKRRLTHRTSRSPRPPPARRAVPWARISTSFRAFQVRGSPC